MLKCLVVSRTALTACVIASVSFDTGRADEAGLQNNVANRQGRGKNGRQERQPDTAFDPFS